MIRRTAICLLTVLLVVLFRDAVLHSFGAPGVFPSRWNSGPSPNLYGHYTLQYKLADGLLDITHSSQTPAAYRDWSFSRIRVLTFTCMGGFGIYSLTLPIWIPIAVLVAYPAFAFIGASRRRCHRRARNMCIRCGYDLTGNVSGVCPECGEGCGKDEG